MSDYMLSFEDFELPFIDEVPDYPDEAEEESEDFSFNTSYQKALMEEAIPFDYYFLGTIDINASTWSVEADYYLLPLKDESFDWALFRINWDDNWSRWEWVFDARLKGLQDEPMEAARLMLTELWKVWGIDVSKPEGRVYRELLENL